MQITLRSEQLWESGTPQQDKGSYLPLAEISAEGSLVAEVLHDGAPKL
jgi:hypothetical protein